MYIERVRLTNIRRFEELNIEFDNIGQSLVIAGDNGDGKTTILRCIAMGLCDEASASALLRELPGEFVRENTESGQIEIFLRDQRRNRYQIVTRITSLKAFEAVKQELFVNGKQETTSFPWKRIFVVAYGAGVRTIGTSDYSEYFAADAVYPLFNYTVPLQNPELAIRRLIDHAGRNGDRPSRTLRARDEAWQRLQGILSDVLNVKSSAIHLTKGGLTILRRQKASELQTLGDGYRATTNWVIDFLSWSSLRSGRYRSTKAPAIVLMDEVEQHLHPRWQLTILDSIKRALPRTQLIATTHSPLVLSSCGETPILPLNIEPLRVQKVGGWLAEDVYREVMGIPSSRWKPTAALISRFEFLHLKMIKGTASPRECAEAERIEETLKESLPPDDPILVNIKLANLTDILADQKDDEKRS